MSRSFPCTEYECSIQFNSPEEVVAHLKWDHNRSELEAEKAVRRSLHTGNDRSKQEQVR